MTDSREHSPELLFLIRKGWIYIENGTTLPIRGVGKQMETDPYGEYMAAAVAAANAASEILMSRFHADVRNLTSWEKSPGALVTEADIESDQAIAENIKSIRLRRCHHLRGEQPRPRRDRTEAMIERSSG